jgi:hypothetical protein
MSIGLLRRGRMIQKGLSNEELLIVLSLQINLCRNQKTAAIDQIAGFYLDDGDIKTL